jgi:hypothetical protein
MTREEAIEAAGRWVQARYPKVPPVGLVLDLTHATLARTERLMGRPLPMSPTEEARCRGRWCVMYDCTWDTDEREMPSILRVMVDDQTRAAELLERMDDDD